jgi:hypothetical protein
MPSYIDPRTLLSIPLVLKAQAPGQFGMLIGPWQAGRISLRMEAGAARWHWEITGPELPDWLQPSHGTCNTLAAAKEAFETRFDAWRDWAATLRHDVIWRGR